MEGCPPTNSRHHRGVSALLRSPIVRLVRARPRIFVATAVGLLVGVFLPLQWASHFVTRMLVGWNVGAVLYVVLATVMMVRSSPQHMRQRAQLQDDGQLVVLLLAALSTVASLVAIAGQLLLVKDLHGLLRAAHIALAGFTVLSSWGFIQVMFTLHYAHDYYADLSKGRSAPLTFPDAEPPTYGDFFYFAAVIGTSGQTADVSFASKPLRRLGTAHCILAYVFNTTVLAMLINIGAGLL
jgi:uncharacterized membrane protein